MTKSAEPVIGFYLNDLANVTTICHLILIHTRETGNVAIKFTQTTL